MALAVDASTPAFVSTTSGNVSTLTSASFTPPLGALLVVMYVNSAQTTANNKPSNTGGAVTWDAAVAVSEAVNSVIASIWRGVVTTSASMTVTDTLGAASQDWGYGVAVITGQAATQNGATQVATSASGLPSGTIASLTGANSLILGCASNFSNATVGTPGTNQTLTFNGHAFSFSDATLGGSGWAQFDTRISLAAGASDTINDTAPTVDYSLAMLEILASTGAVATIPDLIMAPARR